MSTDPQAKPEPRFTQQLTMHLNGGRKFSELHYRIYADGVETQIMRYKHTQGSPQYLIDVDGFVCGIDTFDNLATRGVGLKEWLLAHLTSEKPS